MWLALISLRWKLKRNPWLGLILPVLYSSSWACNKKKLPPFIWSVDWWKVVSQVKKYVDIKTESTKELSNFNFQWTKTLYQSNLKNIAFFFTFFKGW